MSDDGYVSVEHGSVLEEFAKQRGGMLARAIEEIVEEFSMSDSDIARATHGLLEQLSKSPSPHCHPSIITFYCDEVHS